jgi:hypothetical protein
METSGTFDVWPAAIPGARLLRRFSCALFGHEVDNRRFAAEGPVKSCGCGRVILRDDGSETRTRHTLSCFLGHHTYSRIGTRHGHNEYMCRQCGHPLLFDVRNDPYVAAPSFEKKVRYLCGIFGHRTHVVTTRAGVTEYACGCGHSFLRKDSSLRRVTHPPICVAVGHFVRFVERRGGYSEHCCRNCGHTFGFSTPDGPPIPAGRIEWIP